MAALDEVMPKVARQHIIWIESDDEDEQLMVQMERLSVKQEASNCTPQTGKKCPQDQRPSSSTQWHETPPPSRAPPDPPKYSSPKPSTSQTSSTSMVPPAAQATPGRQGIFNAYVVYSGRTPYFYTDWPAVKCMLDEDKDLVFKGFFTLEHAEEAWYAASDSGVIVAIQNGTGRPIWSVTEGVKPALLKFFDRHEAVKIGLGWGGGYLKGWHNEADAIKDWNDKAQARPSCIVTTPDPAFFL
ncbi:hypothetical protein DFJ43DRAFT_1037268 [Lentinula guzmanii]|uniref:Ribonuclease H1 N-terminal domain-containing protein n=1 Tax=Lentinula guzmanii TaxID=2804957 RepID=A0AA38N2F2_9AGAR|nr:hypothetical protein DFJ43DRAFT_1037268 [Lentinula guzmanii]